MWLKVVHHPFTESCQYPGYLISSLPSVKVFVFNKLQFDVAAIKKTL